MFTCRPVHSQSTSGPLSTPGNFVNHYYICVCTHTHTHTLGLTRPGGTNISELHEYLVANKARHGVAWSADSTEKDKNGRMNDLSGMRRVFSPTQTPDRECSLCGSLYGVGAQA